MTRESSPAWDSPRPARRGQGLLVTLAALALVPALVATLMRLFPPTDDGPVLVASFIPYGVLGYAAALVCLGTALLRARRRLVLAVLTLAVALLMSLQLSWLVPFFVADDRPLTTPTFGLLSLNMLSGSADPQQLVAAAQQADVVVLLEATPPGLRALRSLGWDTRFPYAVGGLDGDASDTAIYSRFPLSKGRLLGHTSFAQWSATVQVPQVGSIHLVAVHPCNPYCGSNLFTREHEGIRRNLQPYLGGPLLVAGDFNAVDDHGPMQNLKADGLESATDIVGAGWLPTYPANRVFPPLIPIDHIMLSHQLTVTSVRTVRIANTDHLGLFATIGGSG